MRGAADAFAFAAPAFLPFSPRPACFPVGATVALASTEAFVPVARVGADLSAFVRPFPRPFPVRVSVVAPVCFAVLASDLTAFWPRVSAAFRPRVLPAFSVVPCFFPGAGDSSVCCANAAPASASASESPISKLVNFFIIVMFSRWTAAVYSSNRLRPTKNYAARRAAGRPIYDLGLGFPGCNAVERPGQLADSILAEILGKCRIIDVIAKLLQSPMQ